ncbi:MAG: hypothetical protein FD147_1289 [Chloroflexi bacterium]|nr:MAG: hypothetical protein FD147_1289 [Chloroflexota bacterium]MBA4375495.1 hypothetical protein [Anaerolinea sp.]
MDDILIPIKIYKASENILIRPLVKSDLPALEWEGEYTRFRNVFSDLYMKIENGVAKAWVAVAQESYMVGQVFLQLTSDRLELANGWNRAYLYSFRIRPAYRNKGLGTKMHSVLENALIELNFTRLTLNVARDNKRAIRLYHRLGFHVVADEPGVWTFPDHNGVLQTVCEPSWRMEKSLKSTDQHPISAL